MARIPGDFMFDARKSIVILALLAIGMTVAPALSGRYDDQPDSVVVQHILIGFKRSVPGKKLDRTKKEAKSLAESLLERARSGEDFDALVREYTDDSAPGIIIIANEGRPLAAGSQSRRNFAVYFGDVSFSLEVGEFGLARYHGGNSPYGWHVIKRLE